MKNKKAAGNIFGSVLLCLFLLVITGSGQAAVQAAENKSGKSPTAKKVCFSGYKVRSYPFYVYRDANSSKNRFFPTGYMGDFRNFNINNHCRESPYSGTSCIKIIYRKKFGRGCQWAGLYWQYHPNNWGNIRKAYDLTGAKRLTFWARGKEGGEVINKFVVGGISGKYHDSGSAYIGPITLSKKWKKYTINLRNMTNLMLNNNDDKQCQRSLKPLSRIVGGFCWATSLQNRERGITFYLDEVRFENGQFKTAAPQAKKNNY